MPQHEYIPMLQYYFCPTYREIKGLKSPCCNREDRGVPLCDGCPYKAAGKVLGGEGSG